MHLRDSLADCCLIFKRYESLVSVSQADLEIFRMKIYFSAILWTKIWPIWDQWQKTSSSFKPQGKILRYRKGMFSRKCPFNVVQMILVGWFSAKLWDIELGDLSYLAYLGSMAWRIYLCLYDSTNIRPSAFLWGTCFYHCSSWMRIYVPFIRPLIIQLIERHIFDLTFCLITNVYIFLSTANCLNILTWEFK